MLDEGAQGNDHGLHLTASPDGGLVGVIEPGRVVVLSIPELMPVAEIGIEGKLDDNDVVFVGGRLIVLNRSGAQPRLHVVDPTGPTKVGEVSFRVPMRIVAVTGDHVLATGGGTTAIVDLAKTEPIATTLPVRGILNAAGPMGPAGFVIASGSILEEWDAVARKPLRRLRLGRPLDPEFVGGHADRVWMISRRAPQRIEIIALTKRSSHDIELVAAPHRVVANAQGDLLVMICGETCSTYVVDIAHRVPPLRIDRGPMCDVAWLGAHTLVLQPLGQPLELLSIPRPVEHVLPAHEVDVPAPAHQAERDRHRDAADEPEAEVPPTRWTREEISQRLTAWRKRVASRAAPSVEPSHAAPSVEPSHATVSPVAPVPYERRSAEPVRSLPKHGAVQPSHPGGWRSEIASWARSICARSYRAAPTFDREILDELIARLELDDGLRDAVILLYGAYLNGLPGVAPIDVAAVLNWVWDEAIGDGRLARSGIVHWRRGLITLVPEAISALDGRPPCTGTIVGFAGTAVTGGAIVAPNGVDVLQLGTWAAPVVGALLVPNRLGEQAPHRFVLEARIRGLVPLVPWTRFCEVLKVPPRSAAVLVEHAAAAAGLDLPVVATWSTPSQSPG